MKRMLTPALMGSFAYAIALAPSDAGTGVAVDVADDTATDAMTEEPVAQPTGDSTVQPPRTRGVFTPEQIAEIRNLRAKKHPEGHDKAGSAVHSHKALGLRFGTTAGVISQIVRNRTYKNANYTPVNDGK